MWSFKVSEFLFYLFGSHWDVWDLVVFNFPVWYFYLQVLSNKDLMHILIKIKIQLIVVVPVVNQHINQWTMITVTDSCLLK